jgi:bifunctional N-acetylglucosamine-1-phosphate-uridyltransferase/glucosamine-1-phosphate-acetyltransferase GlmU-like protein
LVSSKKQIEEFMLKPEDFFELEGNPFFGLFEGVEYVWDALKKIKGYIKANIQPNVAGLRKNGPVLAETVVLHEGKIVDSGFVLEPGDAAKGKFIVKKDGEILPNASVIYAGVALMDDGIQIGKGTVVEPGALIKGPTIILNNTEVRQGAYIRGDVMVGNKCVVGHTTEMKASVMLGGSKAGHFAYIGDSILGSVNLGAGTKLANLKIVETEVILEIEGKKYETGLKKFGAILGDGVEIGCNTVTSPGTLLGNKVLVYPNTLVRGYHPANTVIKLRQNQESAKGE